MDRTTTNRLASCWLLTDGFKRLIGKLTKEWILCHLRDCRVHLKQAKMTFIHFCILENKLDNMITNAEKSPVVGSPTSCEKNTMADINKASFEERDYNEQAKQTIVFYNANETKDKNDDAD